MTDQPTGSGPRPADGPDPLDDTQRVEVPRYSPTPDPRPDTRWAWGGTSGYGTSPSTGDGGSPAPGSSVPPAGSVPPGGSAWPPSSAGYAAQPAPVPVPVAPRRRSGGVVGPVIVASVLSAVLASTSTVAILDRTGAFDRAASGTGQATGTPVGVQVPVTIDESSAVIDASAAVSPAVVRITTQGAQGDPFGAVPSTGVGSGIIYDSDGWILTNRHVVAGSETLIVELRDGREFQGRVYGVDSLTDLAIVKIDQTGLPVARIGQSDGLKVGQLVVAIGSPLGTYSFSVTSGIVSGTGRTVQVDGGTRISNLIQTDAAINPGNSGGPLVDAGGNVVGVNTAVATDSNGIGFAIPIDIARPIMEQAVAGEALSRPWIGIRFETIDTQLKAELDLPVDAGALISSGNGNEGAIVPNSPAAAAGLRDGDIILRIDAITLDREHPLDAMLVRFSPGDTITLDVLRDGTAIQVEVTLGTRPADL
jgi:S1-C subfamily serine protease